MELNKLTLSKDNYAVIIDKFTNVDLSLKDISNEVSFCVLDSQELDLNIRDFSNDNRLTFYANKSSKVNVRIINDNVDKKIVIKGDIKDNAVINFYFADFSSKNLDLVSNVILEGENSKGSFRFSSVANDQITKKYNVGFDQIGSKSNSEFIGYGVSLKTGEINAKGITHIEKNVIKAVADQKIKVILFDKESKAKASPTLRIDSNDIIANHACAIGSLNEDHIFYLRTRGLDEAEARRLITIGYLIPLEEYFDKNDREKIDSYIKENF